MSQPISRRCSQNKSEPPSLEARRSWLTLFFVLVGPKPVIELRYLPIRALPKTAVLAVRYVIISGWLSTWLNTMRDVTHRDHLSIIITAAYPGFFSRYGSDLGGSPPLPEALKFNLQKNRSMFQGSRAIGSYSDARGARWRSLNSPSSSRFFALDDTAYCTTALSIDLPPFINTLRLARRGGAGKGLAEPNCTECKQKRDLCPVL